MIGLVLFADATPAISLLRETRAALDGKMHRVRRARALAVEPDGEHLRLCSGLARAKTHRFYEAYGHERRSVQFAAALSEG